MTRWLTLAIGAALGLAFLTKTGPAGYNMALGAVVCAVAGLGGLALQVQRPLFGIAALVVSAAALPLHVGERGQLNAPLALAALICACWLVREMIVLRRLRLTASPVVATILALMGSAVASFFAGRVAWYPVPGAGTSSQLGGLAMFLLSGGVLLAVSHQLRSIADVKRITYLFLAAGSIVPFLMMVPQLDRIAAPTISPSTVGSMFWIWLVGMAAAQALFNQTLSQQARMGLTIVVLAQLFHSLVQRQDWASGWLPPLIALGIVSSFAFPRTVVCATLAGGAAGLYAVQQIFAGLMAHETYSMSSRLDAWGTLWSIISKSPIFGVGLSNYYHFTQLYSTSGWYVKFSSHNNYLDLAAQTGFVGLFLFLCFGASALSLVLRLKPDAEAGFERAYVIGCIGCVAGSLVSGMLGDWIIPFVYNVGLAGMRSSLLFWVFVGGALALWRLRQEERSMQEEAFEDLPAPIAIEPGFPRLPIERPI